MSEALKTIEQYKLVPVIVIEDADDALPLAEALISAGLPVAEVTFRTAAAQEAIRRIAAAFPEMALGAGTVLTTDQVKSAVDNGAKYIVAPGFNSRTVAYCLENNITIIPGIATPTEIEKALEFGLGTVKFFPAEELGGINYLKAVSAPYGNLKFIPTGGISAANIASYLNFTKVAACGGSWIVKNTLIANKEFGKIEELTAGALKLIL